MNPIGEFENHLYESIKNKISLVHLYENLNLRKCALELIPIEDLNIKATQKLSLIDESDKVGLEDFLILELLNWFKYSFFTWIDVPPCTGCNNVPEKRENVPPLESELIWGAKRIEHYFCTHCNLSIRFPRYFHPRKLLETRKGRCGEWANCFALMCRSLGFETRLVMDWSDHIWTEIFSFSQNRWLHCDPCENICDKPLIYELGWKKKINYVIAISKDEVQDVTWRYTHNFNDVIKRRSLCRESFLLYCIKVFTNRLQEGKSIERKNELLLRRVRELAEFLTPPQADDKNLTGRTSGSLAWRMARGEYHPIQEKSLHIFELSQQEIKDKIFHIKYNCALDKYIRISDKSVEIEKWETLTFDHSCIFRKIENDWNMVYLARTENSPKGIISWKFNFEKSGLVIKQLSLNFKSRTFENGMVKWMISSDIEEKGYKTYNPEEVIDMVSEDFKGSTGLIISAELTGGSGQIAWQHTQLFRQSLDSTDFPFEVKISLDNQVQS